MQAFDDKKNEVLGASFISNRNVTPTPVCIGRERSFSPVIRTVTEAF